MRSMRTYPLQLTKEIVEAVDRIARARHVSRSAVVRWILEAQLRIDLPEDIPGDVDPLAPRTEDIETIDGIPTPV